MSNRRDNFDLSTANVTGSDELTAQVAVAMCAIEALIAVHPKPDEVRRLFDQLFGQMQAGLAASGEQMEVLALARLLAQKIFLPAEKSA